MSCGCKQTPAMFHVEHRQRATMCHWCIWAEREPGEKRAWKAVACTVSGLKVEHHVLSGDCPKGHYPAGGYVRHLWMRWYGVPAWMWWALGIKRNPQQDGCGCNVVLKGLWLRVRPRLPVTILTAVVAVAVLFPLVVAAMELVDAAH